MTQFGLAGHAFVQVALSALQLVVSAVLLTVVITVPELTHDPFHGCHIGAFPNTNLLLRYILNERLQLDSEGLEYVS